MISMVVSFVESWEMAFLRTSSGSASCSLPEYPYFGWNGEAETLRASSRSAGAWRDDSGMILLHEKLL